MALLSLVLDEHVGRWKSLYQFCSKDDCIPVGSESVRRAVWSSQAVAAGSWARSETALAAAPRPAAYGTRETIYLNNNTTSIQRL